MNIDTKRVLVEELTYSGSAFGVLANGEGVFINSRIVEKMELSPGTAVYAQVLPNFTDKKDNIPWRVVNVVVDDVEEATFVQQIDVHADTSADDDVDVKIFDVLDEAKKPMTIREIFEATDLHLPDIRSSLHRQRELVSKVEVFFVSK
tara:strand:+ start:856 stop:1299 length:444 start_codon:yes stop_codon:yes gene_type:complete